MNTLPRLISQDGYIKTDRDELVAVCDGGRVVRTMTATTEEKMRLAEIVNRVNAYPKLVARAKERVANCCRGCEVCNPDRALLRELGEDA